MHAVVMAAGEGSRLRPITELWPKPVLPIDGRPVIATRVSDLPEVLEGCGVIVEPNSIVELAQAIARLMANPEERARLGSRARQRFVEQFSEDVVAPRLASVIDEAMALAGR